MNPFSLQALLVHEDITTVTYYMHMEYDTTFQAQKRKYIPGDHLRHTDARQAGKTNRFPGDGEDKNI